MRSVDSRSPGMWSQLTPKRQSWIDAYGVVRQLRCTRPRACAFSDNCLHSSSRVTGPLRWKHLSFSRRFSSPCSLCSRRCEAPMTAPPRLKLSQDTSRGLRTDKVAPPRNKHWRRNMAYGIRRATVMRWCERSSWPRASLAAWMSVPSSLDDGRCIILWRYVTNRPAAFTTSTDFVACRSTGPLPTPPQCYLPCSLR